MQLVSIISKLRLKVSTKSLTLPKSARSDSPHNVLSNLSCFQYTEVKSFYYEALRMFGVLE